MRIIVVCGAGASSTFVATRLRRASAARGIDLDVTAVPVALVSQELARCDLVLLGAHMAEASSDVRDNARDHGVPVIDLPHDIASDRDGARTLAIVTDLGSVSHGIHR